MFWQNEAKFLNKIRPRTRRVNALMAGVRCVHMEADDPMVSASPITAQSIAPATSVHGDRPTLSTRSKPACGLWRRTRVNEGRIRLERTIGAIDSDILSTMGEKTPEYRVGQVFHMTGLDIKKSIIRCLDV